MSRHLPTQPAGFPRLPSACPANQTCLPFRRLTTILVPSGSSHSGILAGALGALVALAALIQPGVAARRANIVLIMTDNQGAWTLGCYGNPDIRTPNIDRLARQGLLLTRAFASNAVCSPTRATFLTGLLPSQHGVHCFLRGGRLQVGPQARNTLAELTSLPEVLRDAGYTCGLVGKWHLGDNLHPQEGFDGYWITMPHGGTSTFYDAQIIENGKIRKEPTYLTQFWTEHAVRFIEQNKDRDQPFFLFLAYNGPYALGRLLLREGRNRHAAYYADKPLKSFPREPTHPWQYANRDYINNPVSMRRVATEVSGVDDGVGTVLATLKKHGLEDNTIVIFTADQGWVGGHGGFWGMGDHTRPLTAYDGMLRIPMIWRHPGQIPAGRQSDVMVSNYDFMPTLLGYLGLRDRMPERPKSPGRDFSPLLRGKKLEGWDNTVFYEFENTRAIRTDRWKYIHRHPNGPHELYDLAADPLEQQNLVEEPDYRRQRQQLHRRLDEFFNRYADPKYDLWHGGTAQTLPHVGIEPKIARRPPVEPPPLPPDFKVPEIHVPDGYTVELAAGPPLVEHPMMACFDDRGRLFVAESAGLNLRDKELEQQLPNSIRLLEDADGDGRFDRSTVFADKMTLPQGALWYQGALYVASPPNIWRLVDTDGDGVADRRDILVHRFGYTGNAASIHGCFLGPEGRIWWCDGRHGHELRDAQGNVTNKGQGAYIFSCNPDGSDARPHCGGGMDNPVEVDFTDEGEVVGTVNILYRQPRIDCLVHWLYGGVYPHSERVLGEFKRTGDLLGPIYKFGHVAVSGMMRYRSGVLDRHFRDDMFVTIFNLGKVVRCELDREGATFRAVQHEFFSCDSGDFHPTDVLEDADGSLLVVDTGGWFRIGCPTSQIAKPEIKGAIYRVRRRGMTPLVDPWGLQIQWHQLPATTLANLLNDTRFKVRERAIAECAARGNAMVPVLDRVLRTRDSRQRRNAVWALTRIGTDEARAAVRRALADDTLTVRLAACHSVATTRDPAAVEQLIKLLAEDQPPVRREAATALGRIGDRRAVPALLQALGRPIDRAEEHALIYALIEINDPQATAPGLAASQPGVRRGALIALDQMDDGRLQPDQVAPLLDADDQLLQLAALDVFERRPKWADHVADVLGRWLYDESVLQQRKEIARRLLAAFLGDKQVAQLIGRVLAAKTAAPSAVPLVLEAISGSVRVPLDPSWVGPLTQLLSGRDQRQLLPVLAAIGKLDTTQFNKRLQEMAADPQQSTLVRVAALEAAGRGGRLPDAAFDLLLDLLQQDEAPTERLKAAQMLGAARLARPQLERLVPALQSAGPLELRELVKAYNGTNDAELGRQLMAAIEQSPGFWALLPAEIWPTVSRCPPEVTDVAKRLMDQLRQQVEQKQQRLSELHPLLDHGDPAAGRKVFLSEEAKCSVCHRVGQDGGQIGPDLSTIGRIRSGTDLLEAIVFPSSSFVRGFQPYSIITLDGKVFNGIIARETPTMVYLYTQAGEEVPIARSEIDIMSPSTVSIMPQGLDKLLGEQRLADVIAYLKSLK